MLTRTFYFVFPALVSSSRYPEPLFSACGPITTYKIKCSLTLDPIASNVVIAGGSLTDRAGSSGRGESAVIPGKGGIGSGRSPE
jgi:hypothetical protein